MEVRAHEHLFADDRPFAQCHASTLVALPDDRFLAAWFGGTREKHDDVAIWGAERANGQWSPPRRIAKVGPEPHWNPVLFRDSRGMIHLFFKVGKTIGGWETWTMASKNGGARWTRPRPLVPDGIGGRGPVKNKPIVVRSGAWLAGASYEREGRWDIFIDRSDDNGQSWQATALIPLDRAAVAGEGVIQPTLWESTPGRVHLLARSTGGFVCRSDSDDDGRTWSAVRPIDLPNNNSGLDLAPLASSTLALAHNPVTQGRTPLVVSLSDDNGQTWPRRIVVWTGAGEYSYPALIPTDEGLAMTYTFERTRIAFWTASLPPMVR